MITLDFTSKRVKRNGKCMSKFDIAYLLDEIKPHFNASVIYDAFSYDEMASYLKCFALERLHTIFGVKIMVIE